MNPSHMKILQELELEFQKPEEPPKKKNAADRREVRTAPGRRKNPLR